jgi:hypothetical protein
VEEIREGKRERNLFSEGSSAYAGQLERPLVEAPSSAAMGWMLADRRTLAVCVDAD